MLKYDVLHEKVQCDIPYCSHREICVGLRCCTLRMSPERKIFESSVGRESSSRAVVCFPLLVSVHYSYRMKQIEAYKNPQGELLNEES